MTGQCQDRSCPTRLRPIATSALDTMLDRAMEQETGFATIIYTSSWRGGSPTSTSAGYSGQTDQEMEEDEAERQTPNFRSPRAVARSVEATISKMTAFADALAAGKAAGPCPMGRFLGLMEENICNSNVSEIPMPSLNQEAVWLPDSEEMQSTLRKDQ
uniref:Uncharacterized protein n=1 Tax=Oryza brachyantha TaxID=4533 RepID=J3M6G8_ORYBR